ncbi:YfcC family protein [Sedimentibacter sp. MB31-C6]|uniref:YfcC family protein n=1 Tax=Sedimentibacter sp. MB31-C6 TaxID=3109366 RepID=UPI002DDD37F8|nr:YfcC family protein [Sedimentibacter sp. MB36-C1]WSI03248.1 YfcC family protein [Sedimentibacter sp. MB36-C1]
MNSQKKKFQFPSAFTVLFIILILAGVLTYIVPAGLYSRLSYDTDENIFIVENQNGENDTLPATQETLDSLNIRMNVSKFLDGSIKKPIAIPDTYQKIEQSPQGLLSLIISPVEGVMDTVDIMVFVLILGGIIGLINKTGTFDAGIAALSKKTKGKEFLLVVFVSLIIALGGTTFGLAEETIALYPILMPIFLASGYDAIVCIAAIYMGSSVGTMFSTVNPFSVVIASDAAGISFSEGLTFRGISLVLAMFITLIYIYRYAKKIKSNPKNSLIYEDKEKIEERFLKNYDPNNVIEFNWRRILILVVFLAAFPIMIWGVSSGVWWFSEMSALFLAVAFIIAFLTGFSEREAVNTFLEGAADLVGVVLIIGVARAINIVMDNGMISDTLLNYTSSIIENMNRGVFAAVQMILFSFLGFFIPSSSGLATLSMPIMAPLADTVEVSRAVVVTAYNWGQGWMSFITPTGLILATLEMVDVTYNKWLKFILPLMGIIGIFAILMLALQTIL